MKITIQDARTSVTLQQRDFRVTISGARGPAGPAGPSEWGGIDGDIEDQTDLYNALQAKVPYTGATQDVNLGEYGAQLGNLEFDNTPTNVPTTAGSVYWNDTDGTLNLVLKGGQTISRVGETQHIRALNNTGAQIARGKVVYVVGAQGQRLTIGLADADTEILSKDTIGFTAEAIADGAEGFVIVQGVINNVSTTGMTDGATVYLSQTAGGYTTTAPTDPAHLVVLGFIVNGGSGGAGSIYVKVDNGYELEELHGVADATKVTPVGADALLLRDSADNNLWKRLTWTNALAGVKTHMDTFKSVAGGYASLDGSGKVPASELPSYVDDVVEVANYAALPGTGETGKIYVTLDTNKCYRWSGSVYVQVAQGVDTLTTTGTSGAATLVGSTLNIPQYQGVLTNPVTGTGTAGQVAYFNGTSAVTGSANLFWDAANNRLGVGTNAPQYPLDVSGIAQFGLVHKFQFNSNTLFTPSQTNTFIAIGGSRFLNITDGAVSNTVICFDGNSRNVGIGSGTSTAPSARLHVRGSGTTSATIALLVQNSTPSALLQVNDDGGTRISGLTSILGANIANVALALYSNGSGGGNFIMQGYDAFANQRMSLTATGNFRIIGATDSGTSGDDSKYRMDLGFAPTSGTRQHMGMWILQTINQTGGANGITRGIYVNPVITAAADWRSIETSNNTGYAIYTAGTANSYFGGNVGIGTASPSYRLHNVGSAAFNNGASGDAINILNNGFIVMASTRVRGFSTTIQFQDSTFTDFVTFACANGSYNYFRESNGIGLTSGGSARLHVRGSGTTSATTALLVQNSTPTELFKVLDNGAWNFNGDGVVKGSGNTSGTTALTVQNSDSTNLLRIRNDARITLADNVSFSPNSSTGVFGFVGDENRAIDFGLSGNNISSSGSRSYISITKGFAPTSGTAIHNALTYSGTINQTGGANGITRGLYVNPTLTAAADWRSIETSNNTGYAAYFAGSADLFLGNGTDIQIGTTTGTKIGTATNQLIGLWNATPIVQPTTAVAAATRVGGAGNTVTDTDTFDGYTIAQLVKALRNMGALA